MRQRWQNREQQPAHADDWLITYADMITLLLCFFAIFIVVHSAKKDAPRKEQPMAVKVVAADTATQQQAQPVPYLPDPFPNALPFRKIEAADFEPSDEHAEDATQAVVAKSIPPEQQSFVPPVEDQASAAALPPIVASAVLPGDAKFEQKGDRITTLEINSAAFFGSGSAVLSAAGKVILQQAAANLQAPQFKDYQITVEGHTDDTPINTVQFPSNWELSTARAAAVVHFFLDQGIAASKLRAAGYADTFAKVPNRDARGNAIPGNQAQNRRVVIKLEKIDRQGL